MQPVRGPGARVVVAGGAGFLGSHVCTALLAAGASVLCLDDLSTGRAENLRGLRDEPGFRFERVDVTGPVTVDGPVDAVLHLASPASPIDYARLPLATLAAGSAATLRLLELAEAKSARFLLASTSEVYGEPEVHPQPETYWGNVNPIGPRSVYDEAKRFAEALTTCFRREKGVDTGIVRIFNTYGPGMRPDDGRLVPTLVGQALRGEPATIAGTGEQTRSLCYVSDTVRGLLAFTDSGHPGPVNIGSDRETTVREIADVIAELTGGTVEPVHVPRPEDDPTRRRPDISLARDLLGWRPTVPLVEGLSRTIEAMAAEHAAGALR
ncbi:NAD-dependent epimerase/dehydratase family protein [Saccharothrix obliqua]|uniref:NAD-dependent epimerase/dehydratase family protein n=1 Tax=Saccharothrix obliqua TaxID=2861747 RepID=UPI001C605C22|nr:NAD-dependent epimerase/dehydratase family protein [Saccharothrix obliqua]MBW4720403.1 NAD-dependent epimerase/dehydratase family protein [Saccharothrix obliqua]